MEAGVISKAPLRRKRGIPVGGLVNHRSIAVGKDGAHWLFACIGSYVSTFIIASLIFLV